NGGERASGRVLLEEPAELRHGLDHIVGHSVEAALGSEEHRRESDSPRPPNIRVHAVAHHAGVLRGQPHARERQLKQRRLGLADDERTESGRRRHRLHDGAAAWQEVIAFHGETRVEIRREECGAARPAPAGGPGGAAGEEKRSVSPTPPPGARGFLPGARGRGPPPPPAAPSAAPPMASTRAPGPTCLSSTLPRISRGVSTSLTT